MERGVPNRCPILSRCRRRSNTIALFNNLDVTGGINLAELEEPYISVKGEAPYMTSGNTNWLYGALCPEVPLFEHSVSVVEFSGSPITKGQYDKYMEPTFQVIDTGHFSECAEYSEYQNTQQSQSLKKPDAPNNIENRKGFLATHWQWTIGTIIAILALIVSFAK